MSHTLVVTYLKWLLIICIKIYRCIHSSLSSPSIIIAYYTSSNIFFTHNFRSLETLFVAEYINKYRKTLISFLFFNDLTVGTMNLFLKYKTIPWILLMNEMEGFWSTNLKWKHIHWKSNESHTSSFNESLS